MYKKFMMVNCTVMKLPGILLIKAKMKRFRHSVVPIT